MLEHEQFVDFSFVFCVYAIAYVVLSFVFIAIAYVTAIVHFDVTEIF